MSCDYIGNINQLRKITALVMVLVIASVSYGSIDKAYDAGRTGGCLKACGTISIAHSLIANIPAAHDNNGRSGGHEEGIEKTTVIWDFFSKIVRKLLQIFDGSLLVSQALHAGTYFLTLCIPGCSFLFYLFLIRFIHLADGSK